jgi:hypothetical protein
MENRDVFNKSSRKKVEEKDKKEDDSKCRK